jgi:DNA repair protein RAD50
LSAYINRIQVGTRLQNVMKQSAEDTIKELEEDIKHLKNASPSYDSYTRLTKIEIPNLEIELQRLNEVKEKLVEQFNMVSLRDLLIGYLMLTCN